MLTNVNYLKVQSTKGHLLLIRKYSGVSPKKPSPKSRLSQLNIDELCVHLNVLCLKYLSKNQSYNDHACSDLLELSQKVGRTSFYDKLLYKKFI